MPSSGATVHPCTCSLTDQPAHPLPPPPYYKILYKAAAIRRKAERFEEQIATANRENPKVK